MNVVLSLGLDTRIIIWIIATVQLKEILIHAGILHVCFSLVEITRVCVCTHTCIPKFKCNR